MAIACKVSMTLSWMKRFEVPCTSTAPLLDRNCSEGRRGRVDRVVRGSNGAVEGVGEEKASSGSRGCLCCVDSHARQSRPWHEAPEVAEHAGGSNEESEETGQPFRGGQTRETPPW